MLIINTILSTASGESAPKLPWSRLMDRSGRKGTRAGGFILFVGIMAGAVIGGYLFGEPSAGLLAGGALGVVIALALWLRDRRYTG